MAGETSGKTLISQPHYSYPEKPFFARFLASNLNLNRFANTARDGLIHVAGHRPPLAIKRLGRFQKILAARLHGEFRQQFTRLAKRQVKRQAAGCVAARRGGQAPVVLFLLLVAMVSVLRRRTRWM